MVEVLYPEDGVDRGQSGWWLTAMLCYDSLACEDCWDLVDDESDDAEQKGRYNVRHLSILITYLSWRYQTASMMMMMIITWKRPPYRSSGTG